MAKQSATADQKKKRQLIIVGAGGAILLAVLAFQLLPKLLGGSSSTPSASPAPTATTTTTAATSGTPTGATTVVVPVTTASAGKGSAVLAGVVLPAGSEPAPDQGKLESFTLFAVKDPFVQVVDPNAAATAPAPTTTTGSTPTAAPSPAPTPTPPADQSTANQTTPAGATTPPPAAPKLTNATITVNKVDQPLALGDKFPTSDPVFVLKSVKAKSAKIAVAGGAFESGSTVTLQMNKTVTLVNTTTGVRYQMKLVYTGTQPEQVKDFTTSGSGTSTTNSPAP